MKAIAFLLLLGLSGSACASISTVDFVKIKNGNRAEAIYYYENNWLKHRIEAFRTGVIESFELLISDDPNSEIDILLITTYRDSAQFERRETNFQAVMSANQPNGRRLLNDIQPEDFREIVNSSNFTTRP